MYKLTFTNSFKHDVNQILKRNYDSTLLTEILFALEASGKVPENKKPHKLSGNFYDCWECHIKPDWLIIWRKDDKLKTIELIRTGTHSDLFK